MTGARSGMITKDYARNFLIKPRGSQRPGCLPTIRGSVISFGHWQANRDYSRFMKTSVSEMPPTARAVPCRSNCAGGKVLTMFLRVCRRTHDSRHPSENDETGSITAMIFDYSLFTSHLQFLTSLRV